tara:strand:- start:263 stop:643 length:381 start_codon:yes stop_codon:yes gene_type:complete
MRLKLIFFLIFGSIILSTPLEANEIGRYQILNHDDTFVKLLILDTTNGDLFQRVNKFSKKNLKITQIIDSKLELAPIGTYQIAHTRYPDNFIDVMFLINTSSGQIFQLKKGEWVKENYKQNDILNN